jgi:hypothetical protein
MSISRDRHGSCRENTDARSRARRALSDHTTARTILSGRVSSMHYGCLPQRATKFLHRHERRGSRREGPRSPCPRPTAAPVHRCACSPRVVCLSLTRALITSLPSCGQHHLRTQLAESADAHHDCNALLAVPSHRCALIVNSSSSHQPHLISTISSRSRLDLDDLVQVSSRSRRSRPGLVSISPRGTRSVRARDPRRGATPAPSAAPPRARQLACASGCRRGRWWMSARSLVDVGEVAS